jgi:hypothetical protein
LFSTVIAPRSHAYTNDGAICWSANGVVGARGCRAYINTGATDKVINTVTNCTKDTWFSTVVITVPCCHAYTNAGTPC